MENYRINTKLGIKDTNIKVQLNQTFDNLEILSLKINQENIYKTFNADYGVLIGRVIANEGLGIPNAKISVFLPISEEDKNDDVISFLYPYSSITDKNENGVRYNLLPKIGKKILLRKPLSTNPTIPSVVMNQTNPWIQVTIGTEKFWETELSIGIGPETPVGTFPSAEDITSDSKILYIYETYYKYTTVTNDSGDYMIFGVPIGQQIIHMDVDLSDIGRYSYSANAMISNGISKTLFSENNGIPAFKGSNNLEELPQILSQNYSVNIIPLWGESEDNEIGITRHDFNININSEPIAYMAFNYVFDILDDEVHAGFYDGNTGGSSPLLWIDIDAHVPGNIRETRIRPTVSIDAIRYDETGKEINGDIQMLNSSEAYKNGIIILGIPCYSDKVVTDEFGNTVPSTENRGIGTKGKWKINIKHNNNTAHYKDYSLQMAGSVPHYFTVRRNRVYTVKFLQREVFQLRNGGKRSYVYGVPNGGWVNGLIYFGAGWFNRPDDGNSKSRPTWLEVGPYYRLETRVTDVTDYLDKIVNRTTINGNCSFSNFQVAELQTEVNALQIINNEEVASGLVQFEQQPLPTTTGIYSFYKGKNTVDCFKEVLNFLKK